MEMNFKENKGFRLLEMYERLKKGEYVVKAKLAEDYAVSEKTIQRDIDDLRAFLMQNQYEGSEVDIRYSKAKNAYHLVQRRSEFGYMSIP